MVTLTLWLQWILFVLSATVVGYVYYKPWSMLRVMGDVAHPDWADRATRAVHSYLAWGLWWEEATIVTWAFFGTRALRLASYYGYHPRSMDLMDAQLIILLMAILVLLCRYLRRTYGRGFWWLMHPVYGQMLFDQEHRSR